MGGFDTERGKGYCLSPPNRHLPADSIAFFQTADFPAFTPEGIGASPAVPTPCDATASQTVFPP
ncbi:TPA: hypothetical protein ACFIS3_000785 [Neisseria gonorrhoeae]